MYFYDAHTHLNENSLYQDWETYLKIFFDAGGRWLINSWASEEYNKNGIEIAKKHSWNIFVKACIWRHPLEVVENIITEENYQEKIQELKNLAIKEKEHIVGIGETGIDLHFANTPKIQELQKQLFKWQCELAQELDLPIIIHSRDARNETIEILQSYPDLTIYFHCWGYGPEEVKLLQKTFSKLYIGFCGNITYKKADMLRASIPLVAKDQLLLETDAPYLSPQRVRWEKNHPANVVYIYEEVAKILNKDMIFITKQIENNFKRLYIK